MLKLFSKNKKDKITLNAISKGTIIPLEEVNDPVFSTKMMGDGLAINIEEDNVCSPIDGKITLIANTLHAFGIVAENGIEVMVHIGLETVNLNGEGFTKLLEQGSEVKKGQAVIKVDREFMKSKNINLVTPVIVLNGADHPFKKLVDKGNVTTSDTIIEFE